MLVIYNKINNYINIKEFSIIFFDLSALESDARCPASFINYTSSIFYNLYYIFFDFQFYIINLNLNARCV